MSHYSSVIMSKTLSLRLATVKTITKSKYKMPSSIKIFFFISQFFFGIDFGFSTLVKKKYRYLAQRFTLSLSVFHIVMLFAPLVYKSPDIWICFNCVEYPMYFILLNTLKYTMYNFVTDVHEIYEVKTSEKAVINLVTLVYLIFGLVIKSILTAAQCLSYDTPFCIEFNMFHYVLYNIPSFGLDVLAITQILIYYYLQCCAKNLKEIIQKSVNYINFIEKKYLVIADVYDKIRILYDKMTILELGIGAPKMMVTIWWMLNYIKGDSAWYLIVTELVFGYHIAVQIALPAIAAEMLNAQMDGIKLIINEYLRTETDDRIRADLSRFMVYIQNRPLRHLVLRFIPVDLRLILSLFSLCTTYFIVIVQFTHLYD